MSDTIAIEQVRGALRRQYRAGLTMLMDAVERCPEELWYDDTPTNAFWQNAYHALFFTHLYLMPSPEAFVPWSGHQRDVQHDDGIPGPPDPDSSLPLIPEPYSRSQVLAYCRHCDELLDAALEAIDLASDNSGFPWYPISKLEHQMVNLRHLQHHAAQLADRLRASTGHGLNWAGSRTALETRPV